MKITVNGVSRVLPQAMTVADLLAHLGSPLRGIAVARNDSVVRRAEYESHHVQDGDRVEIITAVAGG